MDIIDLSDNGTQRPRAQRVFTDRESESESFRLALLAHDRRVRAGDLVTDGPRRNVLVYHGVGGIGKTQLSTMLQSWIERKETPPQWEEPPALHRELRAERVDLKGVKSLDVEHLMLKLRAAASGGAGRFDAFDLGLAIYWKLAHPNEAFPVVRSSRGVVAGEQIQDSLTEILQHEIGLENFGTAGAVIRGLRAAYKVTKRRRSQSRADRCPHLSKVVENMRGQAELKAEDVVHLAPLLQWDLGEVPVEGRPQLAVFIDTYEVAQREGASADRDIQRLAYYLPEVFFVITGRNRLGWHEYAYDRARSSSGPALWPDLVPGATGDPRQHLVGMLSDRDADLFLQSFRDDAGSPLIGNVVRERIVASSAGLPLFLDLAVDTAIDLHRLGREVTADSFAPTHQGVVRNLIRDLDDSNRQLLRIGSLLPNWDVDLLSAAAGIPRGRIRERYLERAFVYLGPEEYFPYRVHDVIRASVLGEEVSMGEWDQDDWADAGAIVMDLLKDRINACDDPDEERILIRIALEVCALLDVEANWLRLAAFRYRSLAELADVIPPFDPSLDRTYGSQLGSLVRCYQLRGEARRMALREAADDDGTHPDLSEAALRHYGYRSRGLGHYDEAIAVFRRLLEGGTSRRGLHQHQLALSLMMNGRLADAASEAAHTKEAHQVVSQASLDQWHGRLSAAADGYRTRATGLSEAGDDRTAAFNERSEAFWRCLVDPAGLRLAERLRSEVEPTGNTGAIINCISAQIAGNAGDDAAVGLLHRELSEMLAEAGPTAGASGRWLFALGFHHAVVRDVPRLRATLEHIEDLASPKLLYPQVLRYWIADLSGEPEVDDLGIQWIEDPGVVRQRWVDVVRDRRKEPAHSTRADS